MKHRQSRLRPAGMETLHKHGMGSPLFQSKGPPFLQLLLLPCEHVPGHTSPSPVTSASSFLLQFFRDKSWSLETKTTLMGMPSSPSNLCSLLLIYQQLNIPESPILPSLHSSVSSAYSPLSNSSFKTQPTEFLLGASCPDPPSNPQGKLISSMCSHTTL